MRMQKHRTEPCRQSYNILGLRALGKGDGAHVACAGGGKFAPIEGRLLYRLPERRTPALHVY